MSYKLSRKDFLKGVGAGAITIAAAGTLVGCKSNSGTGKGIYTPGTYTATAKGIGTVKMTATFDANKITDIKLDVSEETESIGQKAADEIVKQLMKAQGTEIDGITGATVTANAAKECLEKCIAQAKGEAVEEEPAPGPGGPGGPRGPKLDREAAKKAAEADGRVFGYAAAGNKWLGSAPKYDKVDETVDTDVVVIGLGHAGVQAVLGAAEKGAKVVGLEAQEQDMFSWYGEDIGAWNSQFAKNIGIPEWNLGEVIDEFVTRGGGRVDPGIVSLYVKNSGPTLDHMIDIAKEMGVDEKVYTYDNTENGWTIVQVNMDYEKIKAGNNIYDCLDLTNYPRHPGTKTWPATVQFMGQYSAEEVQGVAAHSVLKYVQQASLDKAVKDYGTTLYYGTSAKVLIKDDSGRVTGVIAEDVDGKKIQYNVKKGVVVCGGDYAGNAEMSWALLTEYMERFEREGGLQKDFKSGMGGRDGSAVKLLCWAGGMIEPAPRGTMLLGGGINGPWGNNSMLWLNSDGKRYCNEGNVTGAATATARQKAGDGYLVTDKNFMKSICAGGIEHAAPNGGRPQYYQDLIDDMAAIPTGKSEPTQIRGCFVAERMGAAVYKADTLDQLADLMGVSAESKQTWLDSIAHYNELCAAGADTDFGKDPSAMVPVLEAPFSGCKGNLGNNATTPMMVTMSGVMTDLNLNVTDVEHNPIPGLYAAGNCLGGRYGTGYSTPCAGNSIGMAVTHGRLAGQFVVDNEK